MVFRLVGLGLFVSDFSESTEFTGRGLGSRVEGLGLLVQNQVKVQKGQKSHMARWSSHTRKGGPHKQF